MNRRIKDGNDRKNICNQITLENLSDHGSYNIMMPEKRKKRLIEDGFPFEIISDIAEAESWRKEIYRPIYHIHKWWAKRLGTNFRAAIIGSVLSNEFDLLEEFYSQVRFPDITVYDPFMGSGTTIGEAIKLGCKAIGRDINPLTLFITRNAFKEVNEEDVRTSFEMVRDAVSDKIKQYYKAYDANGQECETLYYFWVKTIHCPECSGLVDLFSSYIFAKHAYPRKHPDAKAVCPECNSINSILYNDDNVICNNCHFQYNPSSGPAKRTNFVCPSCNGKFPIASTYSETGVPPTERMFAKLVLTKEGEKEYLSITNWDKNLFKEACRKLDGMNEPYPIVPILDGHNTRQVLNYGYKYWHQMFNPRQLLVMNILAESIQNLHNGAAKDWLICLFSGVLEFNNMFASYKGEGTGAVRHMFSHHILKPERTPLEANLWGTEKSSGSFSNLFRSRIIRAINYKQNPFEIKLEYKNGNQRRKKVHGLSRKLVASIRNSYPEGGLSRGEVLLSCGDSATTDIPSSSVDYIITDPPFFDNIHYSELADFFYIWLKHFFKISEGKSRITTRHPAEVQSTDVAEFTKNLGSVFQECYRILKKCGLMVFSYHHSRKEGWISIAQALLQSGFRVVHAQPVKSEMSVATPKSQTSDPIDIDVFLVCRKTSGDTTPNNQTENVLTEGLNFVRNVVRRFNFRGRVLSTSDIRVILFSNLLRHIPHHSGNIQDFKSLFDFVVSRSENALSQIYMQQSSDELKSDEKEQSILSEFR